MFRNMEEIRWWAVVRQTVALTIVSGPPKSATRDVPQHCRSSILTPPHHLDRNESSLGPKKHLKLLTASTTPMDC